MKFWHNKTLVPTQKAGRHSISVAAISWRIKKIIPVHGPLSGKKDLEDMKEYILMFDQKAKELASQSDDAQKIVTAIKGLLPQRPESSWLIAPNIQMKYLKKR